MLADSALEADCTQLMVLILFRCLACTTFVGLIAVPATAQRRLDERVRGLVAFALMAQVFKHPRCMNCHRSDVPRVRDTARRHIPRVLPARTAAAAVPRVAGSALRGVSKAGFDLDRGWRALPAASRR